MCMSVCVFLEKAKHRVFALPNPLSCSVMNKICLNQPKRLYVCYCHYNMHEPHERDALLNSLYEVSSVEFADRI